MWSWALGGRERWAPRHHGAGFPKSLGLLAWSPGFPGHSVGCNQDLAVTRPLDSHPFPSDNCRGEKAWHVAPGRAKRGYHRT